MVIRRAKHLLGNRFLGRSIGHIVLRPSVLLVTVIGATWRKLPLGEFSRVEMGNGEKDGTKQQETIRDLSLKLSWIFLCVFCCREKNEVFSQKMTSIQPGSNWD